MAPGDASFASARTPEELEHRARRLEALLATLGAGVLEADLEGRFTYANAQALRTFAATADEFVGRTTSELGIKRYDEAGVEVSDEAGPIHRAVHEGQAIVRTVLRYTRGPSVDVWIESQTVPIRSASGELTGTAISFIDVTDRFRLEAAERRGVERMTEVLRAMPTGVVLVDPAGRIEYANDAAAAISGLKPADVIGQLVADPAWRLTDESETVLPYDALPVPTALRERRAVRGVELGVPTLAGTTRWMRVSVFPLLEKDGTLRGAVVTTEDTTERRALSAQLLHAQKIEGIGQLAGGIAHDFNNLLTVILGNAELALESLAPGTVQRDISEIRDAAARGSALTRQLLTFARKHVVQPRPLRLDHMTADLEKLLARTLGEEIVLSRSSDADLWSVKVDRGQMEQVLLNLAVNARDAMPRGGVLAIETRNRSVDALEAARHPDIAPGDFVTLVVKDTGIGMSRDLLSRVFEPFFTTKPVGSGSGLGLSICHGVIKQARGFISVESEPEHGTTFSIHLPRTVDVQTPSLPPPEPPIRKGAGTVLVVEDEDGVRSFVGRALSGYGFDVLSAGTARHGLSILEHMEGRLDLLLTDLVMPDMGGIELARVVRARLPELPVLYMTGYVDAHKVDAAGLDVVENVLLKPFTPMQLARRVQQVLSRGDHARPR